MGVGVSVVVGVKSSAVGYDDMLYLLHSSVWLSQATVAKLTWRASTVK